MNAHLKPETAAIAPGTNADWHARRLAATPRGVAVMGDFFIDHAKNAEFWDIEGRRFIDFAGGIAVLGVCGAIFYGALRPAPADGVEKVPIKL